MHQRGRFGRLAAIGATLGLAAATAACCAQPTYTTYALPAEIGRPTFVTPGPDGSLWLTGELSYIGKCTPRGAVTTYEVPSRSSEGDIVSGPDGNLWFTEYRTGRVGRVTPAGSFTEYVIPGGPYPASIASGPDGNLWFTVTISSSIGRITPDGQITLYHIPTAGSYYGGVCPGEIAAGPDGAMWFTEIYGNRIGRITMDGEITEYPLPPIANAYNSRFPFSLVAGPDGNLWFTEEFGHCIGRITPTGGVTEFALPDQGVQPWWIARGPDGNLWFTTDSHNSGDPGSWAYLGRATVTGQIDLFLPPDPGRLAGITTGPDGNLWFLELTANAIVRASLAPSDTTPPATTAQVSGTTGSNDWYTSAVQVMLTATDPDGQAADITTTCALDGGTPQAYTQPVDITGDGTHTLTYWSVDKAGNTETAQALTVKVDRTPPVVTWAAADPPANASGWNNSPVTIGWTATDGTSGLAAGSGAGSVTFSAEGADQQQTVTVTDQAGNPASSTCPAVNVDLTAPTIAVTAPAPNATYLVNDVVPADWQAHDTLSDIAVASGTVASGLPIDTASAGTKVFTVTATDRAGNTTATTVTYLVGYGISPLYEQTRAHKTGSTVPIKLQILGSGGANLSSPGVTVHAEQTTQLSGEPTGLLEDSGSANPDYDFRYDASLGGYIFNLSLNGYAPGIYALHFTVAGDPTAHAVQFQVR